MAVPQPVSAPLTRAAIFLVVTANPGPENRAAVRSFCADLPGLVRAVEFRNLEAGLSCVMGIGSDAWDRLFGDPRPAELHSFREVLGGRHHAVSTPGDLLFHIRAKRMDLCFEMATQIMARLRDSASAVDEVHGFRYFDDRDLLGFVDGTESPRGEAVIDAALIDEKDAAFAGGSYVIVQKYLHDLDGWNALPTEAQERIIGRTKVSNIELADSIKPTSAHNALTTITENGKEFPIVRDNMPFGRAGTGEFGTYFIGYCRTPRVIEQMIENMFVEPLIIFNITHSTTILTDGCVNFRKFLVEGTEPNLKKISEYVERSLMLVTALSPVIGYDKASKIAHYAMDNDLTLKAAAVKLGFVTEAEFDRVVDPKKMVKPYVAASAKAHAA